MAGNDCCGSANRCEDSAAICECPNAKLKIWDEIKARVINLLNGLE